MHYIESSETCNLSYLSKNCIESARAILKRIDVNGGRVSNRASQIRYGGAYCSLTLRTWRLEHCESGQGYEIDCNHSPTVRAVGQHRLLVRPTCGGEVWWQTTLRPQGK